MPTNDRKKTLRAIRFAEKSANSRYMPAALKEAYAEWARQLRGEKKSTEVTETRLQIPLSKYSIQTMDQ
jgi:hypothetical protein